MSLKVSNELLDQADRGEISDEEIIKCVSESLPFAHRHITGVINKARSAENHWANHEPEKITEEERGQMLRAYASTSIRSAYERFFGVKLAFQNCHRGAAFLVRNGEFPIEAYNRFTSSRMQILAQSPDKVHC